MTEQLTPGDRLGEELAEALASTGKAPGRWWLPWVKRAVKWVLAAAVLIAVGVQIERTWSALHAEGRTIRFSLPGLAASGVLYIAGLACFGTFYWRILKNTAAPIRFWPAQRAYLVGHLGKYVPGKAMVVVLRVGLSAPHGAHPAAAALGAFYETLVMMVAGSLIAALGFFLTPGATSDPWIPALLGLGLAGVFWILAEPRIFPRIALTLSKPWPGVATVFPRLDQRLFGIGMCWSFLGWTLLGLSHWAVMFSLGWRGVGVNISDPLSALGLITAAVALATVLGFAVAVMPGGLGVREWVLMTALLPTFGLELAVVSSLLLRLVWVVAELIVGGGLYFAFRTPQTPASTEFSRIG